MLVILKKSTSVSLQELGLTMVSVLPVASVLCFGSAFTEAEGSGWLYWYCLEEAEREGEKITPVWTIDVEGTEGLAADCSQDAKSSVQVQALTWQKFAAWMVWLKMWLRFAVQYACHPL